MDIMNSTNNTTPIGQDQCTLTEEEILHSYNLTLHVVSVFVLLIVSFLGASLSIASTRFKFLHINPIIINTGKFFGCGVVLATGFIHVLPDAMDALTDPCLPDSWNVYGSYAGLFAMLAALGMQLIEFLAHQRYHPTRAKHAHLTTNHDVKEFIKTEQTNNKTDEPTPMEQTNDKTEKLEKVEQIIETTGKSKKKKQVNREIRNLEDIKQATDKTETPKETKQTHNKNDESENTEETHNHTEVPEKKDQNDIIAIEILAIEPTSVSTDLCDTSTHYHGAAFQDDGREHNIGTYLLELGIAVHSVLIGLALGTTTDSFVALFIALCFHQFFEAIALGTQIANLKATSMKAAIYMIVFFSLTTPVGIAIGIGIHAGTYNPKSVSSLLTTGILDSFSAGILIYVALVNLITAEMGANAFYSLSNRLKFLYYIALYLGAGAMAVIGRWA